MSSITPRQIFALRPCAERLRVFLKAIDWIHNPDKDQPISFDRLVETNGAQDCAWVLAQGTEEQRRLALLWALACAQQVEHLSGDPRIKACNRTTHLFIHGEATLAELLDAIDAADAVFSDARAAATSAATTWSEARTARTARTAARAAADAARVAATTWATTWVIVAAQAAEEQTQTDIMIALLNQSGE